MCEEVIYKEGHIYRRIGTRIGQGQGRIGQDGVG